MRRSDPRRFRGTLMSEARFAVLFVVMPRLFGRDLFSRALLAASRRASGARERETNDRVSGRHTYYLAAPGSTLGLSASREHRRCGFDLNAVAHQLIAQFNNVFRPARCFDGAMNLPVRRGFTALENHDCSTRFCGSPSRFEIPVRQATFHSRALERRRRWIDGTGWGFD